MSQIDSSALNSQAIFPVPSRVVSERKLVRPNALLGPLPSAPWVAVLVVASVIAIGVSGYLAYVGLTSSKIAG